MRTYHLHETTTATPAQILSAITDFGPGRQEIFGNSGDEFLEVHDRGATSADVTEGTGKNGRALTWERLHYDWSDPRHVTMDVVDSTCSPRGPSTATRSRRSATARPRSTST